MSDQRTKQLLRTAKEIGKATVDEWELRIKLGRGWIRGGMGRSGWAVLAAAATTSTATTLGEKATKATHDKWRRQRRRLQSCEIKCLRAGVSELATVLTKTENLEL